MCPGWTDWAHAAQQNSGSSGRRENKTLVQPAFSVFSVRHLLKG